MTKSTENITNNDIAALRDEAGNAGDTEMYRICVAALGGDETARTECEQVILAARAQGE